MEKEVVYVLLGPTASGKTALSVEVAKILNAEIISADSRQVYKGMDLGTGKDLELYGEVPFYLIDMCEAGEKYNLARFQKDAENAIQEIYAKGKRVLICGGTGLYLQGLIQDFKYTKIPEDEVLRRNLDSKSTEELLQILSKYASKAIATDLSTRKRIIRGIEMAEYLQTHDLEKESEKNANRKYIVFGLNPVLEKRRENISKRLKERLESGLIEETQGLLDQGVSHESLQYYGLEYKYLSFYLLGQMSKKEMKEKLEIEIHRFAKRQMTFFRSMETKGVKVNWLLDELSQEAKVKYIISKIEKLSFTRERGRK
jgi:tRNA dimethylallyltransferase